MARVFREPRLIVASHNPGKVKEIGDLIRPFGIEAISAGDLGLPEPEETGDSFRANAQLKARAAAQASGEPALADDSGLAVPALGGAPGIYSARWAGPEKDFAVAIGRVEIALKEAEATDASAYFVCGLALAWPDGDMHYEEGRVNGTLTFPPRGSHGFGYDPIFVPDGYDVTFGEMDPAKKHEISHRADAFAKLTRAVFAGR